MKVRDPFGHLLLELVIFNVRVLKEDNLSYKRHLILIGLSADRILVCRGVNNNLFVIPCIYAVLPLIEWLVVTARVTYHAECKCLELLFLIKVIQIVIIAQYILEKSLSRCH